MKTLKFFSINLFLIFFSSGSFAQINSSDSIGNNANKNKLSKTEFGIVVGLNYKINTNANHVIDYFAQRNITDVAYKFRNNFSYSLLTPIELGIFFNTNHRNSLNANIFAYVERFNNQSAFNYISNIYIYDETQPEVKFSSTGIIIELYDAYTFLDKVKNEKGIKLNAAIGLNLIYNLQNFNVKYPFYDAPDSDLFETKTINQTDNGWSLAPVFGLEMEYSITKFHSFYWMNKFTYFNNKQIQAFEILKNPEATPKLFDNVRFVNRNFSVSLGYKFHF